jgi:hypothetical protein
LKRTTIFTACHIFAHHISLTEEPPRRWLARYVLFAVVQWVAAHRAEKPLALEEDWRRETATKEWRFEEEALNQLVHGNSQRQSCPPKKRRAESITGRTDEVDNLANVLQDSFQ